MFWLSLTSQMRLDYCLTFRMKKSLKQNISGKMKEAKYFKMQHIMLQSKDIQEKTRNKATDYLESVYLFGYLGLQ